MIEADGADRAERHSLRWLWNEMEYEGDLFGGPPDEGYRSLVLAMAAGLDVRLGVEVAEVALSDDGVRVRSVHGAVEVGSHAVLTAAARRTEARCSAVPARTCRPTGSPRLGAWGSAAMRR